MTAMMTAMKEEMRKVKLLRVKMFMVEKFNSIWG